jgi:hypothetical protein
MPEPEIHSRTMPSGYVMELGDSDNIEISIRAVLDRLDPQLKEAFGLQGMSRIRYEIEVVALDQLVYRKNKMNGLVFDSLEEAKFAAEFLYVELIENIVESFSKYCKES